MRDATGPLLYAYGEYKVALDEPAALRVQEGGRLPDRSAAAGPDEVSIATYNLSNLFDPADNPGHSDPRPSAERYAADLEVRARSIAEGLGLPDVVAGSWVYGDFTTWMGDSSSLTRRYWNSIWRITNVNSPICASPIPV